MIMVVVLVPNPRLSGRGLKNSSRSEQRTPSSGCMCASHLAMLCVLQHLDLLTSIFPPLGPSQGGGFHLTLLSPVPIRLGHWGKAVHQAGRQIRKNKYLYLLWNKIGSPGLWEEPSVMPNGIVLWHLAPHVRPRPSRQCTDSMHKGRKGQEP